MRGVFITGLVLAAAPLAHADYSYGGWCVDADTPRGDIRGHAEVIYSDANGSELILTGPDGSVSRHALTATGVNEYALKGSTSGDGLILRADGKMEIYDSEGSYATAEPGALEDCTGQDQ
jgi:hypothetical protein